MRAQIFTGLLFIGSVLGSAGLGGEGHAAEVNLQAGEKLFIHPQLVGHTVVCAP